MTALVWFVAFVAALIVLSALRIPVSMALGIIGIAGTAAFVSPSAVAQIANIAYDQGFSFVMVVVPLFILMGEVVAASGLGASIFRAASDWTRRLPGGLGISTITACAGFASVCGSSPVTAATMGSIAVPEMVRNGYAKRLALGATAAGGTLGILIPPSLPMIIYGVITDTSIGQLFLAGILPGLMMMVLLSATVVVMVAVRPDLAPGRPTRASRRQKLANLRESGPIVLIAAFVVLAIYTGIATPTEAGAVGAAAAIGVAWVLGRLRLSILHSALDRTVRLTAMFMLLLIGGLFSAFVLTRLGVPQQMSAFLTGLDVAPWVIIALIVAMLVVLGMFLDPLSIMVIVVPIFLQSVVAIGYDPVWFGIIVTITIEIAAITPPVGFNLFVLKTAAEDVDLNDVILGSAVFVVPLLVGTALLVIFPGIALIIPRSM